MNFLGCSTSEIITEKEMDEGTKEINFSEDLYITTKDYRLYHFSAGRYTFNNDTLFGKGANETTVAITAFEGAIPQSDIISYEQTYTDAFSTAGLILTVALVGLLIYTFVIASSIENSFEPN